MEKKRIEVPIEGIELPLEFLKKEMDFDVDAKLKFHLEAERVLRDFAEYNDIPQDTIDVIHVEGTPKMLGYVQLLSESFAVEIGSHLIEDGVGARIAHRRPRMRGFGVNIREVPVSSVYDPVALKRCMEGNSISLHPCLMDD